LITWRDSDIRSLPALAARVFSSGQRAFAQSLAAFCFLAWWRSSSRV